MKRRRFLRLLGLLPVAPAAVAAAAAAVKPKPEIPWVAHRVSYSFDELHKSQRYSEKHHDAIILDEFASKRDMEYFMGTVKGIPFYAHPRLEE